MTVDLSVKISCNHIRLHFEAEMCNTRFWRLMGSNRCISIVSVIPVYCPLIAITSSLHLTSPQPQLRIIDSSGLTAAVSASSRSTVNLQAGTRMWRKCLALLSGFFALGKHFIIQVNGSVEARASTSFRCFFQRWVGFKTDGFNVDSRMQEADEQSEGKKKKNQCVERRRRVGELRERGRER